MNIISKIKSYINNKINNKSCINESYLNNLRFDLRADYLSHLALTCNETGVSNQSYFDYEIIVSLTTYNKRIYDVHLAIESIMQGSLKPNRIILWLDDSYRNQELPITIRKQINRGLEIDYCNDIRSYKKLIPTLKKYPSAAIITIDDDCIYNYDLIEKLVLNHKINTNAIQANRVTKMGMLDKSTLTPYLSWKDLTSSELSSSYLNFPTGCGGILYPPYSLHSEVLNEKVFMELCPTADDVWFKAMSLYNKRKVEHVYTHNELGNDFLTNDRVQDIALYHKNTSHANCENDKQLEAVFKRYNLYNILSSDE